MSDPDLKPGVDPALAVANVLTDELRAWLMAELRYPVLAVNSGDGPPHQSVMWFDIDPDEPDVIVMNTMVRRLKYRQLKADPRVSLLFEDGLTWVAMRGAVELDADFERGQAGIRALAVRYHADPDRYAGQERVVIRMRVEKVIFHER
jgi:PPOX class probable F420-dependent enzyme